MSMMTLPSIEQLSATFQSMTQVERRRFAKKSGVPFATLQKVATGETDNPRYRTYLRLVLALERELAMRRDT